MIVLRTRRRVKPRVAAPKRDDAAERRPRAKPLEVLPRKFGWLLRQMGWQIAGNRSQLETVLYQPEMDALLVACPQAIRILRPLCRMLGMDPRFLQPGVVVGFSPPEPAKPKKKRGFGKVPRD